MAKSNRKTVKPGKKVPKIPVETRSKRQLTDLPITLKELDRLYDADYALRGIVEICCQEGAESRSVNLKSLGCLIRLLADELGELFSAIAQRGPSPLDAADREATEGGAR